jgi:type I restriction enzyme S subunit
VNLSYNPPDGWRFPTIEELAAPEKNAIRIGPFGSALKKHEYSDSGVRVLGIEDVLPNELVSDKRKYIPKQKFLELSQYTVKSDDLLVTNMGTVGRTCVVPGDLENSIISSHLIKVSLNTDKALPRYVSWMLNFCPLVVAQVKAKSQGAIMAGFNSTLLKQLRIPLPPLDEQRRIAEVLDRTEALRAKRRAALAQLDTLTHALFVDLFGDPVTNPKGWPDSQSLGEIADIVSGVTKGRDLRGESVREVPYLAVVNVQDRLLNLSVVKTIEATEDEIQRYKLMASDLLLTEGGDPDKLGRGTLWSNELPECIHQNHIFRVRITSSEIHPLFLNWLVGSQRGKRFFRRSAKQTTGIASINMRQLRSFPMLFPPLILQREFARRIAAVEKLKTAHRASLAELNALFAALQHRAFRGEL